MKQVIVSTLIILLLLGISLFHIISQSNTKMAFIFGNGNAASTEDVIYKKLSWIEPDSAIEGRTTAVMGLKTASGRAMHILLAEGTLHENTIEPEAIWRSLLSGGSSIIVNSPDEDYRCPTPSINGKICKACNIGPAEFSRKQGSVEMIACNGNYNRTFHIEYVANAVVVNFKYRYTDEPLKDEDLSSLRKTNLTDAVQNLFRAVKDSFGKKQLPQYLIVPSIGTGQGELPKNEFYNIFFKKLSEEVKDENSNLPETLVLLLWREDIMKGHGLAIRKSIADGIYDLYRERMNPKNRKDLSSYYSLIGISIVMLLLILVVTLSTYKFFSSRKNLYFKKPILITICVIIISFSLTQTIAELPFDFIKQSNYPITLALGMLSVPLSLVVSSAVKLKDELTENGG